MNENFPMRQICELLPFVKQHGFSRKHKITQLFVFRKCNLLVPEESLPSILSAFNERANFMGPAKQEHNMLYVSIKMGNLRYLQMGMDDPSRKPLNQGEKLVFFFIWATSLV